ncbi:hypothetical protein ACIBAC_00705 [Streptomyces sp. NPDC051362]|uniref:hypothetical protein n=1 Tax=Streptomyces sp. NPDC051362 TaxID=3365651 RepID=UPI00379C329B
MSRHSRTKPAQYDTRARRAGFDALLPRLRRGTLTPEEGALLAAYVLEECRVSDANRSSLGGTTRTLADHRQAADAAIREFEETDEAHRVAIAGALEAPSDSPWTALVGRATDAQHWAERGRNTAGQVEKVREELRRSEEARGRLRSALAMGAVARVSALVARDLRKAPQHTG